MAYPVTVARVGRIGIWLPVALALLLGFREIGTADFWWQWAAGKHILQNGIPRWDPWLTTATPQPWIEMRWLYCVALYWSIENVGAWLPIACASAMYAAGLAFALRCGDRADRSWLAAVGVAAVCVMGRRLVVRPEAFTILFLGLLLFVILRFRREKASRWFTLYSIGSIQLLWVNTHALFALGIAIVSLWLIVELFDSSPRRNVAASAVLISVAASLINPYGWHGLAYPLILMQEIHAGPYKENIVELKNAFAFGFTPSIVFHCILAVAVTLFAIRRKGDVFLLGVCLATLYLSITTVRNAPLFAISAAAFLSTCEIRRSRLGGAMAAFSACIVAYSFSIGLWTLEDRLGLGINRNRYALKTANSLLNAPTPIFNTLVEGSLLIAQGQKAFADPRLEVLPPARFSEMLEIARCKMTLPSQYNSVFLTLDCALAGKLATSSGWRLLGLDGVGIAFTRDDAAIPNRKRLVEMVLANLPSTPTRFSPLRTAQSPVPYRRAAIFLYNIGAKKEAGDVLATARRVYPSR
jgi:hypothetical protein